MVGSELRWYIDMISRDLTIRRSNSLQLRSTDIILTGHPPKPILKGFLRSVTTNAQHSIQNACSTTLSTVPTKFSNGALEAKSGMESNHFHPHLLLYILDCGQSSIFSAPAPLRQRSLALRARSYFPVQTSKFEWAPAQDSVKKVTGSHTTTQHDAIVHSNNLSLAPCYVSYLGTVIHG